MSAGPGHDIPWFGMQFANPLFLLAAVLLLAFGARGALVAVLRPPHAWYSCGAAAGRLSLNRYELSAAALLLLIPYLTRGYEMGLGSMGRFVAIVFPIYLVMGDLLCRLPPAVSAAFLAIAALFMAAYAALFAAGYLIF